MHELDGHFFLFQARVDFSALLACGGHARNHSAAFFHVALNDIADALTGQKAGDERAGQVGAAAGLLGGAMKKVVQRELNGVFPMFGKSGGFPHFAKLDFCDDSEHVFLALEVIEERALADVRGLGDVFHCDVGESALGEELEGTAEEAQAGFRGAALASAHVLEMGESFSGGWFWRHGRTIVVTHAHK